MSIMLSCRLFFRHRYETVEACHDLRKCRSGKTPTFLDDDLANPFQHGDIDPIAAQEMTNVTRCDAEPAGEFGVVELDTKHVVFVEAFSYFIPCSQCGTKLSDY